MKYFLLFLLVLNLSSIEGAYAQTTTPKALPVHQVAKQSAIINVNSADAKTLQTVKGLGRKKVQAILEYRQKNGNFKSLEELTNVRGISDKLLEKIKDKLSVK